MKYIGNVLIQFFASNVFKFYLVSKTLTAKGFEKFLVKKPKRLQRKFYLVSDSKKAFYMETF